MALVWMDDYRTRCWNCWGDFFHFFLLRPRVPFFVYLCFPATTEHVSCLKRAKKSTPKRAAGTSQHGCVRTRTMQKHACLHGSCAYATGLPRAILLLCTYKVRAPAHHLPSRWSQSVRTTRLSGHLESFPILFYCLALPQREENFQFLFCSGQRLYNYVLLLSLPQREETLQFCFIGSDPKGRDFAILFYWLCPERRDFTILFYWLCPEKREL